MNQMRILFFKTATTSQTGAAVVCTTFCTKYYGATYYCCAACRQVEKVLSAECYYYLYCAMYAAIKFTLS
jgi:hypothetical protein